MTTNHYRFLRFGILAMGAAYAAASLFFVYARYASGRPEAMFSFEEWCLCFEGVLSITIGLAIGMKMKSHHEHIFFALFLLNFGFNSMMGANAQFLEPSHLVGLMSFTTWVLAAGSFIYAMIRFPGPSALELYTEYLGRSPRWRRWKAGVLYVASGKHFWIVFMPVLIAIALATRFLRIVPLSIVLNISVMFAGIVYFRVSFAVASKSERSQLAWLLWGVVLSAVIGFVEAIVILFFPTVPRAVMLTFLVAETAIQSIALVMSVFFSGAINAGLIVRRTIIYSSIFLVVIFLFSGLEHLIVHRLTEAFHIESDIAGAFLSGLLALLIQPIHRKLEHVLPKF